jgi:hypothetical protein
MATPHLCKDDSYGLGTACGKASVAALTITIGTEEGREAIHLCLTHLVQFLMRNGADPNAVFDGLSAMIIEQLESER